MTPWYRERPLVLGALALGAACVVAAWTAQRALVASPTGHASGARAVVVAPSIEESGAVPAALVARTLDHDPFHPERRRPRTPFRLPAEEAAAHQVAAPTAPVAALRLLGTVVTPGRDAFAMVQLGADAPRVVRAGGTLGGFTLRTIEPGRAVFISPTGDATDLRVSRTGP